MSEAQNTPETPAEATTAPPAPETPATPATTAPKPTAPATEAPAAPAEPAPAKPEAPEEPEQGKPGREAAKYRTQLRAVEAERDTLTASVDNLRRALIAANVPERVEFNTDALWKLTDHTPADFFTEDGALDTAKLTATIGETIKTYKIGHHGPDPIPASGTGTGTGTDEGPSWSAALGKS